MSKIYERCVHHSFSSHAETILINFISAYKKSYSSNHVLLRLLENCKKCRDNTNFVGIVLLDLSKAFDCIPFLMIYLLQNFMHYIHDSFPRIRGIPRIVRF